MCVSMNIQAHEVQSLKSSELDPRHSHHRFINHGIKWSDSFVKIIIEIFLNYSKLNNNFDEKDFEFYIIVHKLNLSQI